MVIGGLCLTAFSSLSMYILLRQMTVFPPFFRWFFRLGVWSFPAIAVGIVLAMLSRVLGIYEPQPYAFLIVEAFGLLCTGLVGLKTMHTLAEFQDPMRSQNALSMWRHRDDSHDLRP
jgi:hypothetical protein